MTKPNEIEKKAQDIIDLFFAGGASVNKSRYDFVVRTISDFALSVVEQSVGEEEEPRMDGSTWGETELDSESVTVGKNIHREETLSRAKKILSNPNTN